MKTRISILLLLLSLSGCSAHVDAIEGFLFSGCIQEEGTSDSLDEVDIIFHDTGYDSIRRTQKKVGVTDEDGCFDIKFTYSWGYETGFYKKEPEESFELIFRKTGYMPKAFKFKSNEHRQDEYWVIIDLNKISMEKSK